MTDIIKFLKLIPDQTQELPLLALQWLYWMGTEERKLQWLMCVTYCRTHGLLLFLLMKFYPLTNERDSVFQGSLQLLHAAWTWPNTQWISRRVPCNWKAVRQVVLSISIPLEKCLWVIISIGCLSITEEAGIFIKAKW